MGSAPHLRKKTSQESKLKHSKENLVAEFISPQEGFFKEGYRPNTEHAALELHRLLAIFLSSSSFAKLRKGNGERWEAIDHLQQFEEDEITRILLSTAVTTRVVDDREEGIFERLAGTCGIIAEEKNGSTPEIPLTLREACNKIIHAQKIRFDIDQTDEGQLYINPTIYLYGTRSNGSGWKATLDVIKFAEEYVSVVCRI